MWINFGHGEKLRPARPHHAKAAKAQRLAMGRLGCAHRGAGTAGGGRSDAQRAEPILKGRVIETLRARFDSRVELDSLEVSLIKGLAVSEKVCGYFRPTMW